jgi:membrane protease YdiL (CAAX protease family)
MRGTLLSHLRAFLSKDWSLAVQPIIFGLLHYDGTAGDLRGNVLVAAADVIALNAPTGYFVGSIALRARSIVLPGLIHMSLDLMKDLMS